jgi:threonine dehydratase
VAPSIPSYQDLLDARERVYAHLHRTPLHSYPGLCSLLGASVWVKHENHHAVGAFKVRGGVNLAAQLGARERVAGLITASTGNHGQSIAFAGKVTGAAVTVAVPEGANPQKVASMRALGAEVVSRGRDFDEAREWAAEQARRSGARFVGPTEPELIAGVGTYALEIFEDLPDVEVILVPVGAGSGACGVCLAARHEGRRISVIGVQSARAPAVHRSWQERRPVEVPTETCAEGLATRVSHANAMQILCDRDGGLDDFLLVPDEGLEEAIALLLEHTHSLAEHAGAASLAGALAIRRQLAGRRVVLVLSGGNLAPAALARILGAGDPPARL